MPTWQRGRWRRPARTSCSTSPVTPSSGRAWRWSSSPRAPPSSRCGRACRSTRPRTIDEEDPRTTSSSPLSRRRRPELQFAWLEDDEELRPVIEDGDFAAWRVFLHPEQRKYAEALYNGAFRLSGGAGTGKTVVLLHRARFLAKRDPQARIVLTTYTRNLADAMKRDLLSLDPRPHAGRRRWGSLASSSPGSTPQRARCCQQGRPGGHGPGRRGGPGRRRQPREPAQHQRSGSLARGRAVGGLGACPRRCAARRSSSPSTTQWCCPTASRPRTTTSRFAGRDAGSSLGRAQRALVWDVISAYRASAAVEGAGRLRRGRARSPQRSSTTLRRTGTAARRPRPRRRGPGPDRGTLAVPARAGGRGAGRPLHRRGRAAADLRPADHPRPLRDQDRRPVAAALAQLPHHRTRCCGSRWASSAGEDFVDLDDEATDSTGYRSARSGPPPTADGRRSRSPTSWTRPRTSSRSWLDAGAGSAPRPSASSCATSAPSDQRHARGSRTAGIKVRQVTKSAATAKRPAGHDDAPRQGHGVLPRADLRRGRRPDAASYLLKDVAEGDREDVLQRERSLFYVAATRARDELVVLWEGEASDS